MAKITSSSDYQRELKVLLLELAVFAQTSTDKSLPVGINKTTELILDLNERAFDASTSFINAQSILSKPIKESDK